MSPATTGTSTFRIPLTRPHITDAIKAKVCATLDSGWITEGSVTHAFEERFAAFVGSRHAIAVTSCTTGLEVALRAAGVGPGDEVIVPDYTFPATASVVTLVGATAVIVDVERDTMLVDADRLEAAISERTKAIIPVSMFGNPLDWDRLSAIRERHGLVMIEDAACSVGSRFGGALTGTLADISVFSFHPRKTLTTGEGGMITTDRDDWVDWMRSFKDFGIDKCGGGESFNIIGTNYKLSDILAAVGLGMMEDLDELLERRASIARAYTERLSGREPIRLPSITPNGEHSWQSYPIFVPDRNAVKEGLREVGIHSQIGTHALHMHPAFAESCLCQIPEEPASSRYVFEHCLVLPMYHSMSGTEIDEVVSELLRICENLP